MLSKLENSPRNADRVYEELRHRILSLQVQPGSVVDEARIVSDMGTSRTPVREAIIRLVSEGLLRRDGRQIRVSSFEVSQLRAFFEAMTLLSRATHRMAAIRRNEGQLKTIFHELIMFEEQASTGNEASMNEANHAFHLAIARAADSQFLERAYHDTLVESLRLSRQCFAAGENSEANRHDHVARIIADHRALHAAISAQDADEAERIAENHATLFRERLARQLLGPSSHVNGLTLKNIA
jgi:DNA-binding GntR family transcriptional regulator